MRLLIAGSICFLISLQNVDAVDYAADGIASAKSINAYFSSNPNANVISPIQTTTSGKTVDGTSTYSGQISCGGVGAQSFLDLTIANGSGGDVLVTAKIDRDLDGTKEYSYTSPKIASGVCSNGIVSCDQGTWNNCNYFAWGYNGGITLTQASPINMGGCYCLNNSCGGLSAQAPDSILQSIGNSITAQMMKYDKNYMITKTYVTTAMASYWGQNMSGCAAGGSSPILSVDPTTTYALPGLDTAKSAAATDPNSAWSVFNSGTSSVDLGVTTQTCNIQKTLSTFTTTKSAHVDTTHSICTDHELWLKLAFDKSTSNFNFDMAGAAPGSYLTSSGTIQGMDNNCPGQGWVNFLSQNIASQLGFSNGSILSTQYMVTMKVISGSGCNVGSTGSATYTGGDSATIAKWFTGLCPASGAQHPTLQIGIDIQAENSQFSFHENDGCVPMESDSTCRLKEELVCDQNGASCFTTVANSINTGLVAPEMCYTSSINGIGYLICSSGNSINIAGSDGSTSSYSTASKFGFVTKRTYECTHQNDTNFEDIKKARQSITVNEAANNQDFSYNATQKDASGAWQTSANAGSINFTPPPDIQYCKTVKAATNQEVVYSDGTNKANATTSNTTNVFTIKQCTGDTYNVCPLDAGESIKNACGSINDMGEVIGVMEGANEAAKDMICSQD